MRKSVLTLGTFDGVHRGHQAILNRVVKRARALKAQSAVLSFGIPPRHAGEPMGKPVLLTTPDEKREIFHRVGVKVVEFLIFNRQTAKTSPEEFFRRTILRRLQAREMIVGPRLAFGRNRAGRVPLLRRLGKTHNVRIEVIRPVGGPGHSISSRRIRQFLSHGNTDAARRLLGYPYSVAGRVVHGDHRGRHIGYPTANVAVESGKMLPPGVFWVKVLPGNAPFPMSTRDLRRAWDGLCNIGTRPTFTPGETKLHVEVFLLRKTGSLYGKRIRVVFLRRIRREKKFDTASALQRQIRSDTAQARRWAAAFSLHDEAVSI